MSKIISLIKGRGRLVDVYAAVLAFFDYRVSPQAKMIMAGVIIYALMPIDIIPDYIPFAGVVDDLLLASVGIPLVMKMLPGPVAADCRRKAETAANKIKWVLIGLALVWLCTLIAVAYLITHAFMH